MNPSNQAKKSEPMCSLCTPDPSMFGRSCCPNAIIMHYPEGGIIKFKIVAIKVILKGEHPMLPFDEGWKESKEPLACLFHFKNGGVCPMETQRLEHQAGKENQGS